MYDILIELHRIVTHTTQTLHVPNFVSADAANDWRTDMLVRLEAEGWRRDLMETISPYASIPTTLKLLSPCEKLKISVSVNLPGLPTPPPTVPEVLGLIEKLL